MARLISGRLVVATHNPGKLREMRELLEPYAIMAISATELGLAEPEETGATFAANAAIKAEAACQATGLPAFADDSGLCVEALDGEPGIHSARFAKEAGGFFEAMEALPPPSPGAARAAAVPRPFRLRPGAGAARRACARRRGSGRRHPGVPTARYARLRLRCNLPAGRLRPYVRRNAGGRKARPACRWFAGAVASRPRLPALRIGRNRGAVKARLSAALKSGSASSTIGPFSAP